MKIPNYLKITEVETNKSDRSLTMNMIFDTDLYLESVIEESFMNYSIVECPTTMHAIIMNFEINQCIVP